MSYLVYQSIHTNYDLVAEDYYKEELRYQEIIDGSQRFHDLRSDLSLQVIDNQIQLSFPAEMKGQPLQANLHFYCPTDQRHDKKLIVEIPKTGTIGLPLRTLLPGVYTVKISWQYAQQYYYTEKSLSF
jgi:hypothetical protein